MTLTCPHCGNDRNFQVKTLQMHVVHLEDGRVEGQRKAGRPLLEVLCDECETALLQVIPSAKNYTMPQQHDKVLLQFSSKSQSGQIHSQSVRVVAWGLPGAGQRPVFCLRRMNPPQRGHSLVAACLLFTLTPVRCLDKRWSASYRTGMPHNCFTDDGLFHRSATSSSGCVTPSWASVPAPTEVHLSKREASGGLAARRAASRRLPICSSSGECVQRCNVPYTPFHHPVGTCPPGLPTARVSA